MRAPQAPPLLDKRALCRRAAEQKSSRAEEQMSRRAEEPRSSRAEECTSVLDRIALGVALGDLAMIVAAVISKLAMGTFGLFAK